MENLSHCRRILVEEIKNSREKLLIRKKKLHDYDLHWHDCFEIELILDGEASQVLNGEEYPLHPGDIYMLNPTDFHSVKSENATVYNLMFGDGILDKDFLQQIMDINTPLLFHLDEKEFSNAKILIGQMLEEFEKDENYSDTYIKNILECLFILILRKTKFRFDMTGAEYDHNLQKALLYIHSHFRENPTMASVAEYAGFNYNYFSGLFKIITGKAYKEYLTALRLDYAKKLVISSNIPITEVCYASGFNSLTNFLRVFKLQYGISPGEMRKEHLRK